MMKKKTKTMPTFAAVALLAVSPALAAETYTVDRSHATVLFQVRHFMTEVAGKFDEFEGTIRIDRERPENSSVQFTVRAASIDTNEPKRDEQRTSASPGTRRSTRAASCSVTTSRSRSTWRR